MPVAGQACNTICHHQKPSYAKTQVSCLHPKSVATAAGCYFEVKPYIHTAHQMPISSLYGYNQQHDKAIRAFTHKAKPHSIAIHCETPGTALLAVVGQEVQYICILLCFKNFGPTAIDVDVRRPITS